LTSQSPGLTDVTRTELLYSGMIFPLAHRLDFRMGGAARSWRHQGDIVTIACRTRIGVCRPKSFAIILARIIPLHVQTRILPAVLTLMEVDPDEIGDNPYSEPHHPRAMENWLALQHGLHKFIPPIGRLLSAVRAHVLELVAGEAWRREPHGFFVNNWMTSSGIIRGGAVMRSHCSRVIVGGMGERFGAGSVPSSSALRQASEL
jgi:hypothetical protein